MPVIVNVTKEEIKIKAAGNWFVLKAGQEKLLHSQDIANFISQDLSDCGICVLPDLVGENEDVTQDQFQERKLAFKEEKAVIMSQALDRYIRKYRAVIANNQVHLRRELKQHNIESGPEAEASQGELDAMRLVARYQRLENDQAHTNKEEVKDLMKQIKGD